MEEFKYLEGIINLCVKELYVGDRNIHATLGFEELKELQNLLNKRSALEIHAGILINKNKELLEKVNYLEEIRANQTYENEELEKMVELMLIDLSDGAFYMDDAAQNCEVKHKECDGNENIDCRECLLEYYKKKVRVI